MTNVTTHSAEYQLSASKLDFFGPLLKFFAGGIGDLNRYLDAASLVHPAGALDPGAKREPSWEGPI